MSTTEGARAEAERPAAPLNYFNYFTEIEDAFVRRRGKHLLLSPMDWALMDSWKQMGVPLHVVLRGIETAFDSYESRPQPQRQVALLLPGRGRGAVPRVGRVADGRGRAGR